MPTIALRDGAKLKVDISGIGPSIILISGLGGTARFWESLVAALGPDLHSIRFDQRGIGASERGSQPVTIKSLAEDVWEIIDALKIQQPILCGHSTGGAIIQEMVLARPERAAEIILSGSWAGPDPFVENMFRIRLDVLMNQPHLYTGLSAHLGSTPRWLRENGTVLQQAMSQIPNDVEVDIIRERIEALLAHDCRDRICQLETRTLVLGAEDDVIIPVYLQEELASLCSNPSLHIFDKGGHFFPVTRPTETAAVIHHWLAGINT